jgi:hypothetical protein
MRKEAAMSDPKDPKVIYAAGVGSGGGPKPHLYADVVEFNESDSLRARLFVHTALLQQAAGLASDIREQYPAAYKALSKAITASVGKLATEIGRTDFIVDR